MDAPSDPTGVVATARRQRRNTEHGKPQRWQRVTANRMPAREGRANRKPDASKHDNVEEQMTLAAVDAWGFEAAEAFAESELGPCHDSPLSISTRAPPWVSLGRPPNGN